MGLQPSVNYKRVRIIGNACLPKLREMSEGDLQHWTDRDLGNILDMAVQASIDKGQVELWWEDDYAFGICRNKVVRFDEELPAVKLDPLFAVVRDVVDKEAYGKDEIIVTVINQTSYDLSIENGRWVENKPEKSRFKHVGDEEEKMEEMKREEDKMCDLLISRMDPPLPVKENVDVVLEYRDKSGYPAFRTVSTDEITSAALKLVSEGASPVSMYVWRDRVKLVFNTTLEAEND